MKHPNLRKLSNHLYKQCIQTYIQGLNPLIKPSLNTLSHQAAPTATAKIVLHALFAECVFFNQWAGQVDATSE